MDDDDLFPVLVYEFNSDGRYAAPIRMSEPRLKTYFVENLRKIIDEKRELRITDGGDNMCFHVKDGKILYDGEKHYPDGKPIPPNAPINKL
jgi:hypothetical protein